MGSAVKSSGALHATVSAFDSVAPAFAAEVIVLDRFFASESPKSHRRADRSRVRSTFPAFMSPCTMDTSFMWR